LEIVGRFVVHTCVGTFLFGVVAGFAVLIWWGTQWLEKAGVPYYISGVTEGVAILFFALDILCLVVFIIAETIKLLRLMWAHVWG
jgi:hypothetical protein